VSTTKTRNRRAVVDQLLDQFGTPYAAEAGFKVRDTPASLFRLLCLSTLLSARIRADTAVAAARALADAGWTTVDKLRATTWDQRVRVINRSGYARYDERTARMLGESADLLHERYGGDLRRLRKEAERDPAEERRLLREFKGMGDVGVDIFFREVQGVWDELRPFVDGRAADSAARLGLPRDAGELARLVPQRDFVRLVAALVRVGLEDAYDEIAD
jgi:hypothetical protein